MPEAYNLHSDFDIGKHKENFINYLEVVIHPDGSVHYAVPSHQEYLIRYICKNRGITREELEAKCPREYYCDFMTWLCGLSGCICVWSHMATGVKITQEQAKTLDELRSNGLLTLGDGCDC